jgi:hypothetical protein
MAAAHTTARIGVAYGAASVCSLDLNEAVQLHEHVRELSVQANVLVRSELKVGNGVAHMAQDAGVVAM